MPATVTYRARNVIDLVSEDGSQQESQGRPEKEAVKPTDSGPRQIRRPAALSKQQRLIMEAISRSNPEPKWEDTEQLRNLVIDDLEWATTAGHQVLEYCGLKDVATPGTGNCQYYAIAMALLNTDFTTAENQKAIENLTAKLKKGLQIAMMHGFDEEYQHDERKLRLLACMKNTSNLSEMESKQLLMEYMEDIAQTSSKSAAFIARSFWGSDFTLRLAAKLLQRPIIVVVARNGLTKPSYQIFDPYTAKTANFIWESAKEVMIAQPEAKLWLERLQAEYLNPRGKEHLPIVLKYGSTHYQWLQFGNRPVNQPQTEEESSCLDMPPELGEEERKTEDATPPQLNPLENIKTSTSNTDAQPIAVLNQPGLPEGGRQVSKKIKEPGVPRTTDSLEFSNVGAFGLAPVVQKLLLQLDWNNTSQSHALETMTGADAETLQHWQQQLHANGISSASTPEDSDVEMDESQESSWSPPPEMARSDAKHDPVPPDIHRDDLTTP
ncbi:hypothetical protein ON010_g12267 [Phytophthora cinnamomi]|nr:hypothetical protein ON010_g12267 [Phytophthora cinnamomi]